MCAAERDADGAQPLGRPARAGGAGGARASACSPSAGQALRRRLHAALDPSDGRRRADAARPGRLHRSAARRGAAAIAECRAAGIAVKMITGDHAATAARDRPPARPRRRRRASLTGASIDAAGRRRAAAEADADTDVFARTSPEHKLRLVAGAAGRRACRRDDRRRRQRRAGAEARRRRRRDGHQGHRGRQGGGRDGAADDNFASIVAAVREGRTVYDNIRKVIAWTLPTNGGEALIVIVAILLGTDPADDARCRSSGSTWSPRSRSAWRWPSSRPSPA